eukprot:scaffold158467_cov28-Tisochrysis_lutea.AAC.6
MEPEGEVRRRGKRGRWCVWGVRLRETERGNREREIRRETERRNGRGQKRKRQSEADVWKDQREAAGSACEMSSYEAIMRRRQMGWRTMV